MKYVLKKVDENEKDIDGIQIDIPTSFTYIFDQRCFNYARSMEYNISTVRMAENYMNGKLDCVGHVFLNDVCDQLGLPKEAYGQLFGWSLKMNSNSRIKIEIENFYKGGLILTFNPDGIIVDKI